VDIFSIEAEDIPDINGYDALIVGTPCYHAAPAKLVTHYFRALPKLAKEMPAFIFNTRGLASLNTNRILSKQLQKKNIITIMDRAYRSPASDGSLIAPFVSRFFEFDSYIEKKIVRDCTLFLRLLKDEVAHGYTPPFQVRSIVNAPNKAAGQIVTLKVHLHKQRCSKCGKCVKQCPHNALLADKDGHPVFIPKKCENCYRCIHHCPELALSLSKKKPPKKTLAAVYKENRVEESI